MNEDKQLLGPLSVSILKERAAGSSAPACSASPFTLRAADKMAAIIDEMVKDGQLDSRSPLADARLNYGEPWTYAHTPNAAGQGRGGAVP